MKSIISVIIALMFCSSISFAQNNITLPKKLSENMSSSQQSAVKRQIATFKNKYMASNEFAGKSEVEFAVDTFSISLCEDVLINDDSSTLGMMQTIYAAAEDYDALLNKYYQKLRNSLDSNGKAALLKAQRAWIAFRDADDELSGAAMPPDGSMWRVVHASNHQERIKQRVIQLFNYYSAGRE